MSDHDNSPSLEQLGDVNADLARSLERCSGMVRDYRERLIAANSNDPALLLSDEERKSLA